MRFRTRALWRGACAGTLGLALTLVTGCAQGAGAGGSSDTVTYWLWDPNQLPAYQACAKGFEKQHPGLRVRISQMGWNDYWTKLTAGFIAGTQPDVFTDHIQKFGQLADLDVLEPLDGLGLDDSAYQSGLAANWTGQDGRRYGTPKDWDTVALFYDKKRTEQAGLSAADLNSLSWNPRDGGSFEKAVARLTVDSKGRRGDEPGFDKRHVVTYGLATGGAGDADGQTTWSPFTASIGWTYTDRERWGTEYQYDSKTFQSVIKWYFGLAEKGYLAPFTDYGDSANPPNAQIASGRAALAFDGAWMLSTYAGLKDVEVGTAFTPTGPTGRRATMMNGLADSITKDARNKEGARAWVKYLASDACQETVGRYGIVLPATRAGTRTAVGAYAKKGIDVTAFTRPVTDRQHFTTFSFPITNYAADVLALMRPTMQDIYTNGAPVSDLTKTNKQINFLLGQ
ncbi:ABC transporter substrate-binding protein [Streptomyces lancefieldiae]|uniref:Sugar ABC transporter substrate-binding protein n=1 Tax=Streptomyces lancefieldiae TaxID=3075520 RepID=A0ABU3AQN6_9ACTN|nr:sugar ABC transporter substrate-binding protein [Streptomyces sp. DSM 40712]MDT0612135.1 sugar ABC transporter substrate-binding protein [Streptomyces sp. DSM 40712]